jgi:predicted O-methyltransferase YrrM
MTAVERYGVEVPGLVDRAIALAEELGFPVMPEGRPIGHTGPASACIPQVGRLLASLVASRPGGRFAEHGTGAGIGTAWMASAMTDDATLVSVELDERLATAAARLFEDHPNVEVRLGDCREALAHEEPFDLVFMDAVAWELLLPEAWDAIVETVKIGGMIVVDDLTPVAQWPGEWDEMIDRKREFALHNSRVVGSEVQTTPTESALIVTRRR